MKRCLLFLLLLFATHAWAQSCPAGTPQTPNVGLYLPVQGSPYWGYCVNGTSSKLDSLLSGLTALPALSVTGQASFNNVVINGTCTGSGCGGGSGNITGNLTPNNIPVGITNTSLGPSLLNDNHTTLTYGGSGGLIINGSG